MLRNILNFIVIFLMLSTLVFANAKSDEIKLQNEYGKDLTHVPFFLKFSFYKQYNRDWKTTYYSERKEFLHEYEIEAAKAAAEEREEARAQAEEEKARLRAKRDADRDEHNKEKAKLAQEKADAKAEEERQKSFDQTVKDQEKELQQMEEQITQRQ